LIQIRDLTVHGGKLAVFCPELTSDAFKEAMLRANKTLCRVDPTLAEVTSSLATRDSLPDAGFSWEASGKGFGYARLVTTVSKWR